MSKFKVYLSGPINGCTTAEAKDWRTRAAILFKTLYDIEVIDPFVRDYRGTDNSETFQQVVHLDKMDIRNSDCVLVNWNDSKRSVGTIMEILYAWEQGIPVVIVMDKDKITPVDISPWLQYHVIEYFYELEHAIEFIGINVRR